jgi:hypothetical protein
LETETRRNGNLNADETWEETHTPAKSRHGNSVIKPEIESSQGHANFVVSYGEKENDDFKGHKAEGAAFKTL